MVFAGRTETNSDEATENILMTWWSRYARKERSLLDHQNKEKQ